jgi:Xaa-Pro aminopeptidase
MERREFVTVAGGALMVRRLGGWAVRPVNPSTGYPSNRPTAYSSQEPTLGPATFARRIERAQAELKTRKWDFLVAPPSANYLYFTGDNPGTSERLIALIVPALGDPAIVCPAFEVDRIKAHTAIHDVRAWEEQANPYDLVKKVIRASKPRANGTIALEASAPFATYLGLKDALDGWRFEDATGITARIRIIKSSEEVALIRRAIAITEDALAATFAQLAVGMSERDTTRLLASEMDRRGAPGDGLVQFGPSSALPHGGPGGATLQRETVVLIDCGCRVAGYTSDITRTVWFGDHPSPEFKTAYNLVHDAQTAAIGLGKPLLTLCQEMDRAARRVITEGGFGPNFTHRLGHGIGLDGHEPPYLVEGSETRLEPGMVFTLEPGIYQAGKFGVRIEDDCVMTESGVVVLSHRPGKL